MSDNKIKFRDDLKKWININQEIEKMNLKLKKYRVFKNKLTPNLIEYMKKKNKAELKINKDYNLKLNKISTYDGLNKNYIFNMASKFFNNKEQGNEFTEFLYKNRKKTEKSNLIIKKKIIKKKL
jgi:hypothetical protein